MFRRVKKKMIVKVRNHHMSSWENVQRKYRGVSTVDTSQVQLAAAPTGKTAQYRSIGATIAGGLLLFSKVEKARKEEGSALKVIGSTKPKDVVLSSLPGFLFAMSYYGLRSQVREKSAEYAPSYLQSRVQPSTMPLIAAGFVSTAVETVIASRVDLEATEPFPLGQALGILVGAMAANKIF